MMQSNVIVTYAPARRSATGAPARDAGRLGARRVGVTLAGALLAGGAAFTLGTFVRPDGTIREPGTAVQSRTGLATGERAIANATPEAPAAGVPEAQGAEAAPLPFLALVRDVTPSLPPAVVARSLASPAAREAMSPSGRVAMRAERRLAPAFAPAPAAATIDDDPAADAGFTPLPPAPTPGVRRDLEGFLGEQGLVLATEAQAAGAIAPVSEWEVEDFAAADGAPPTVAAAAPLALAVETAFPQGEAGVSSEEPGAETAALAFTAEAADDLPLAEAVSPVIPSATTAAATADLAAPDAPAPAGAEELAPALEPVTGIAALTIAPMPSSWPASAHSDLVQIQSFPLTVVNGEPLGAITLRDFGAQGVAVHLGALVGLLKLRMPEAEFVRLSTAAAADRFVTLDTLRAAGIGVRHDLSEDRLFIEAR